MDERAPDLDEFDMDGLVFGPAPTREQEAEILAQLPPPGSTDWPDLFLRDSPAGS